MRYRRSFVTYIIVLGLFSVIGAIGPILTQSMLAAQGLPNAPELASSGNQKIQQSLQVQRELQVLGIDLSTSKFPLFDGKNLSLDQRRQMQGKLAQYLVLVNQVLEIDALKNLTIDNRARLLNGRNQAEAYQKAIENFEQVYGENYRPNGRLAGGAS